MSFTYSDKCGHSRMQVIDWAPTASASDASVTSETTPAFTGYVIAVETNPGSVAPTDNYDLTITDADGADVLLGAGADRDTANTELAYPRDNGVAVPVPVNGTLTFNIANNAVNSATFKVRLFLAIPG